MLWHLALSFSAAQSASLFNQVVASTGNVAVQQGITYAYTVGEVVISTEAGTDRIATQGFHQPEQTRIVQINEPSLSDWEIEIFPNPTADVLNVRFASTKGNALTVTVVDLLGKVVLSGYPLPEPGGSIIDCQQWQPGVYFLQINDPVSRASATTRIIRL